MKNAPLIVTLLKMTEAAEGLTLRGWIRTRRDAKGFSFLEVNDGSCLANAQVIVDASCPDYAEVKRCSTGASVIIEGDWVASKGTGQSFELQARGLRVIGEADSTYPLQKKGHSPEFLREIAHLRPRTNLFGAVFRVRSRLAYAIHRYFQDQHFHYVHTPVITGSDCEGAGEMFRVTSLDPEDFRASKDNAGLFEQDFFCRPTYLTVSGQLEAEVFACALNRVYTFGPTFRAENSNTSRHASEFWMIEPEMAFFDLRDNMTLAEDFLRTVTGTILQECREDLQIFNRFIDKGLLERLEALAVSSFQRVSYTEAVDILLKSGKKFEYPVSWGINLQSEHERFLTGEVFKKPVIVHDYPATIKPFYMRRNDDDKTVGAMDVLAPGIGEIIGGSQREERLDVLRANLAHHQLSEEDYHWYLDLRRFGTVPHSGFGLGFERFLMFLTGVANIRDVIPFPRTPGNAEF